MRFKPFPACPVLRHRPADRHLARTLPSPHASRALLCRTLATAAYFASVAGAVLAVDRLF